MTAPTLAPAALTDLVAGVEDATARYARRFPGEPRRRQPVHTVYVPADRFDAGTARTYGRQALRLLGAHAPDGAALSAAIGLRDAALGARVLDRVTRKLAAEPVEDLRVDFEDGYGLRDDAEEDRHALAAAGAVADALTEGELPRMVGLRVKPFCEGLHGRSIRTLDLFVTALVERDSLPEGFVVTFPKVLMPEHVESFVDLLGRLEQALGLSNGRLVFEVQIETTQSVIDRDGGIALRRFVEAAGVRLTGAHFGVFDYTAACGLPPDQQRLDHPACDWAREAMRVALAGTGVRVSDGSTNVVPRGDDTAAVHRAWRQHADHVRHSLTHGFRQGWDLHPAQLPSRFAAVYGFYLDGLDDALARIAAWRDRRAAAEVPDGDQIDEPATIKALSAHVQRAVEAGAVTAREVAIATGADADNR